MKQQRHAKFDWHSGLRILCAVALMAINFAHRPVAASTIQSPEYFAEDYRLPDGSFSGICLEQHSDGEGSNHPHSALFSICDACILTSSLLLPQQDAVDFKPHDLASLNNPWPYENHSAARDITLRYFAIGPPVNFY